MNQQPGFFGIERSNRDFTHKDSWGKNQFNSSFPASLACYMHCQNLEANYLCLDREAKIFNNMISIENLFQIDPSSKNIFFAV
jgi:hypothetical protein